MDVLKELGERVSALELHRQYDVELNKEQTKKLDEAVAKIDEIYIGFRWLVRFGKFLTALTALIVGFFAIKENVGG